MNLNIDWSKAWKDLLEGGIFIFLGALGNMLFNKRKNSSEAALNEIEAKKKQAEEEAIRAKMILDLQTGLFELQTRMTEMQERSEKVFEARELERTAKREEINRILAEQASLKEALGVENAKNFSLVEEQRAERQRNFEKDLASQQKIEALQAELAIHRAEVVEVKQEMSVIKKKTGSLDSTGIPDHSK